MERNWLFQVPNRIDIRDYIMWGTDFHVDHQTSITFDIALKKNRENHLMWHKVVPQIRSRIRQWFILPKHSNCLSFRVHTNITMVIYALHKKFACEFSF